MSAYAKKAGPFSAPVHCAAGSEGETNFGSTSVATPKSRVVQRCEILFYRPTDRCRIDLFLPLFARDRALTIGVSFNQTCIDREPLTTDQTGLDARSHDALEHTSKNIALAKALIAGTRESRVVGDRVFQAQITEPAIGEVDLN